MLKNGFFTVCYRSAWLLCVVALGLANASTIQKMAISDSKRELNLYANLTLVDLKAAHDYIRDNSPVTDRPSFVKWLEPGYKKAVDMAQHVTSLGGYTAVMRYYANGFHNYHLRPLFLATQYQYNWPQFLIAKKNKNYEVVHNIDEPERPFHAEDPDQQIKKPPLIKLTDEDTIPPIGAKLVECNGLSPKQLMKKNVAPFYSSTTPTADWDRFSPWILVDQENPWFVKPDSCKFEINHKIKDYPIHWVPIKSSDFMDQGEHMEAYVFGKTPRFGVRYFGNGNAWVSVPIFYDRKFKFLYTEALKDQVDDITYDLLNFDDRISKKLIAIKEKFHDLKNMKVIVYDLRGNPGGFGSRGYKMFDALYGNNYGELIESSRKKLNPKNKVKIYALTDGRCGSACWLVTMKLKKISTVTHIGRAPAPDDLCESPKNFMLPSKLSAIGVPVSCDRDPIIEFHHLIGKSVEPKYRFNGNMADTKALQKWVLQLNQSYLLK